MESPPKRITRSRAAKSSDPSVKTTKIVTAAARAKSTATSSTRSTAAKRKTRADENEDEEDHDVPAARRARGRPRKMEPEIEVPATRSGRIRTVKSATVEASNGASVSVPAPAPAKATRGRPRKAVAEPPAEEPAPEPVKKTTRGRAATTTTTKATTATAKPVVKKTVKFQEPDKENIEPATKAKEPATIGLRGRPARRGATTTARTTKASTKSAESSKKKPLSPKKVTQVPVPKDESEDELAGETTPVKPMMKSPIKPPSNVMPSIRQDQATTAEDTAESDIVANMTMNPPDLGAPVMGSPAKRPPGTPFKDAMKSPAKRIGAVTLPGVSLMAANQSTVEDENASPFKASMLQSAAKRPQSPIKGLNFASTNKPQQTQSAMKASFISSPAKRAFPGMVPLTEPRRRDIVALGESPAMKPIVMATPTPAMATRPSDKLMMEDESPENVEDLTDDPFVEPIESLQFSGRLSAILPRHADPAWKKDMGIVESPRVEDIASVEEGPAETASFEHVQETHEETEVEEETVEEAVEDVAVQADELTAGEAAADVEEEAEELEEASASPTQSPSQPENPMFQLREKDLDPCHDMDSESEDELGPSVRGALTTPVPSARKTTKIQGSRRSMAEPRVSLSGFTPLADRFGSWSAASPIKMPLASPAKANGSVEQTSIQNQELTLTPRSEESPLASNFFDEEMLVQAEVQAEQELESPADNEVEEPSFVDMMVTDEDVELAHEANEMSLMEPEQMEDIVNTSFDDTLSEASQEYGDENEVPIDPAMTGAESHVPVTPVRPMTRAFHTTTKVPLKPADDSTPSPIKKRSFSASRTAPRRPRAPTRNATVISYSPTKDRTSLPVTRPESSCSAPATPQPVTPTKSDLWSAMGTPARTPRRDLDSAMLRGAVVFVDVHTSEGADASGIFIELLTQMGAKCLKTWAWQPNGETDGESAASKIGITHVVYKDGGKRTMEKVRQTNGVVQCVGVSWVLDCERENEWLDEAPYYIDTSLVPRGGARRRKSMEPQALANLNGTLVSSPVKGQSRDTQTVPNTPLNRRESSAWMHTPSDRAEDEDMDENDWSNALLTPVPKTPAPDAIARYAANIPPETPSADYDEDDLDYESPTKQSFVTRTCPPKKAYREMGQGILSHQKDEQVLQRLMAVRRKSLQFAPKIGSPLARAWK